MEVKPFHQSSIVQSGPYNGADVEYLMRCTPDVEPSRLPSLWDPELRVRAIVSDEHVKRRPELWK
jgi:hypothetical protein